MNSFGYIALTVLIILALLVWLHIVPDYLQLPLFFLALTLLLVRLTLRLLAQRTKRQNEEAARREAEKRPDEL